MSNNKEELDPLCQTLKKLNRDETNYITYFNK